MRPRFPVGTGQFPKETVWFAKQTVLCPGPASLERLDLTFLIWLNPLSAKHRTDALRVGQTTRYRGVKNPYNLPARSQRLLLLQSRRSVRRRPTRTGSGSISPLRSCEPTNSFAHNFITLVRGRSRRVLSTKSGVLHWQIGSGSIPPLRRKHSANISRCRFLCKCFVLQSPSVQSLRSD